MIKLSADSREEVKLKLTAQKIYYEWICAYADDPEFSAKREQFGNIEAAIYSGTPALFHKKGLEPELTASLKEISARYGCSVIEDRRNQQSSAFIEKRRQLAFIIGLSSAILFQTPAVAENSSGHRIVINISSEFSIQKKHGRVRITRHKVATAQIIESIQQLELCNKHGLETNRHCIKPQMDIAQRIKTLLVERLKPDSNRPEIINDLSKVANYYSQFPFIVEILDQLATHPFRLQASNGHWLAEGNVKHERVESATIYFDFRSAAQMHFFIDCEGQPLCTASPSDALLHELLHAYLMFKKPEQFIKSARPSGYPHKHEDEVIALERSLYQKMSQIDKLPRPERHRHAAKIVAVDCPLCWTSKR